MCERATKLVQRQPNSVSPAVLCRLRPRPASIDYRPWREPVAPETSLLDWCLARLAMLFPDRPRAVVCDPVDGALLAGRPVAWPVIISEHVRDLDAFLDAAGQMQTGVAVLVHLEGSLCPLELAGVFENAAVDATVGLALLRDLPPGVSPQLVNVDVARRMRQVLSPEEVPPSAAELFAYAAVAGVKQVSGMGCGTIALDPAESIPRSYPGSVSFESSRDVERLARIVCHGTEPLSAWRRDVQASARGPRAPIPDGLPRPTRAAQRDKQRHVLFVSNPSAMSGAETSTLELVRALADTAVRTSALVAYEGHWTRALRGAGCTVYCRNQPFNDDGPDAAALCAATLDACRPDVVHYCGSSGPTPLRVARAAGTPVVYHAHVPTPESYFGAHSWTDRFVAVSDVVREALLASGAARSQVAVVPNGVDATRYAGSVKARQQSRRDRSIPDDAFVVLTLARFSPEKRLGDLVDAVALLRREVPGVQLLLAGESHSAGSTYAEVTEKIRTAGLTDRVRLLGFVPDIDSLLAAADVVVLCSDYEGLPMLALEAFASGVPLVATAVGGLRALMGSADDPLACGLRAPHRDPSALASLLARVHARPPSIEAMIERGRVIVQQQYSADRMARGFLAVYAELLSVPPPRPA